MQPAWTFPIYQVLASWCLSCTRSFFRRRLALELDLCLWSSSCTPAHKKKQKRLNTFNNSNSVCRYIFTVMPHLAQLLNYLLRRRLRAAENCHYLSWFEVFKAVMKDQAAKKTKALFICFSEMCDCSVDSKRLFWILSLHYTNVRWPIIIPVYNSVKNCKLLDSLIDS